MAQIEVKMGNKKGYKHTKKTKEIIGDHSKENWKSETYRKKVLKSRKEKILKDGYKNSPETRKKISKIMKKKWKEGDLSKKQMDNFLIEQRGKMLGKKQSEYQKKKASISAKEARKKQITPIKDTKIEVKVQDFLKKLKIEFYTHQYMKIEHGYQCDILIPSMNLVIECDGDYWHKYPIGNELDHIRTKELIEKGFKVMRLWENEIKTMDLKDFKNKLGEDK